MTLLFISDIHGISTNLDYIDQKYNELNCDKLVVLGDLYHNYSLNNSDIDTVEAFFDKHKNHLICVRGNCDSDLDVRLSTFNIMNETNISIDGLSIYLTHGHIHNILKPPEWSNNNNILIYGHQHIPFIQKKDNNYYINPGSISLPRNSIGPTYMVYKNKVFTIYDILGNEINKLDLKN